MNGTFIVFQIVFFSTDSLAIKRKIYKKKNPRTPFIIRCDEHHHKYCHLWEKLNEEEKQHSKIFHLQIIEKESVDRGIHIRWFEVTDDGSVPVSYKVTKQSPNLMDLLPSVRNTDCNLLCRGIKIIETVPQPKNVFKEIAKL